jgi:hypothetical protein
MTASLDARRKAGRSVQTLPPTAGQNRAVAQNAEFDLLPLLHGNWQSVGKGWNIIALPAANTPFNYRVLMNQYSENLQFKQATRNIPNRGIAPENGHADQLLDALDYEQSIRQLAAVDFPATGLAGEANADIHHEPGLLLRMLNHIPVADDGSLLPLARLATIPHGNSVLALGSVTVKNGPPSIPVASAIPQRVDANLLTNPYLGPYKNFEDSPFFGTVQSTGGFPGFFPTDANAILRFALDQIPVQQVIKTTTIHFDTRFNSGGIANVPFLSREANAAEMQSTFWVMDIASPNASGSATRLLMYSQTVMLDFFASPTFPGARIRWPHISINTLEFSA